jgi:hypothetical protein
MFETSDIAIASYVMMKGLRLVKAERERSGRFKFMFDDSDGLGNSYAVEYVNSESAKFDAHMKNLKNVLYKS